MTTGNKQVRNDQQESLLAGTFTTRKEYMRSGARLLSAVLPHPRGIDGIVWRGGQLIEGFMADCVQAHGMAATASVWTMLNTPVNFWLATNYGGPYLWSAGASALYIPDASWQEAGNKSLFVWKWVLTSSLAFTQTIESKYDTNNNQCSWRLWLDSAGPTFSFSVNAGGAPAGDVTQNSSVAPVVDKWFFVAGFFYPSAQVRILVGSEDDDRLTSDTLVAGVPASVFNTTAPLTIASSWNNFGALTQLDPWRGNIGVGSLRFNMSIGPGAPYDPVLSCASRLFQMTRWFYQ